MSHNDDYIDAVNPQANSWLSLEIYVQANQPNLLQGLDQWLQLDLISEAQVKKICRHHLSCPLPEIEVASNLAATQSDSLVAAKTLVKAAPQPNIITQVWLRFLDELSIRWLLFLGIFLVVISSGVLAASQWNNFPKFGQYLILLAYTLCFWGFGFWSSKQNNLKLTSQTLRASATLLIPINFWAINHFGLGSNIWEWITIAIAFVTLTATIYFKFQLRKTDTNKFFAPFFLILSYLHLGWKLPILPLIAVYSGIIAISLIHYKFFLPRPKYPRNNLLFLFAAWSLLLARGLIDSTYTNYNLAIALFAWLLGTIYLTQDRTKLEIINTTAIFLSRIWQFISLLILSLAWIMSIVSGVTGANSFYWQTIGISVLAIHLFNQRLTLYWRKRDLTAIFLVGLQTLYISKELIPSSLRSQALDLSVAVSKTEYFPESVFGITLFPYVILFVFIASWLYRRQKLQLALYAEWLTLILGMVLTCLSLSNPTWRSLNLLLSTATLGYVAYIRQPLRNSLVYLTHLLGLVTVINAIAVNLPNLSQSAWGSILVLLLVGEWGIYLRQIKQPRIITFTFRSRLQQSFWYFGLLLAAVSYTCFLSSVKGLATPTTSYWGLVWLIIPGMLTLIAKYTRNIQQRRLATSLSCIALILAQLLFGQGETRFIALAIAICLMYINTFNLRRTIITAIHLGFVLSLTANLLSSFVSNWNWLPVGVVILFCVYQFRLYLKKAIATPKFDYISQRNAHGILGVGVEAKNYKLMGKYIQAADYWAIALIATELAVVSIIYLNLQDFGQYSQYLLTTILLIGAIFWRYRQQPNNLVLYTLVWLGELLTVGVAGLLGGNGLVWAIANVILGLLCLIIIAWLAQTDSPWARLNLAYVPLVYAALGIIWRLTYFDSYTGLLTLGAALTLVNTRQNNNQINKLINYLGLAGISVGIYELVIYRLLQSSGGSVADGLTVLALVAAAIAFTYRLMAWWYRQRRQTTMFNLSLSKVILIAHLHWAMSSIFKIMAAGIALESAAPRLTFISIATSFCLGAYALIQGRRDEATANKANDWWVYIGLVEIVATLVYSRLIITRLSLFDPWRVIFTCAVALLIYQIPWQNLGWRKTPWQRTALIIPALMTLITAEDVSYLSLIIVAAFYLRIVYYQKNLRWSYISLGFINWGIIRLVWQYNTELIWIAGIISLSILYVAQFDPYFKSHRRQRHYLRIAGSSFVCVTALFYPDWGLIPGVISFSLIFVGLGFKIRAFLFVGTVTLILTTIYQLIILVLTYSFLKWIVGLVTGICSIIIAAGFEQKRDRLNNQLKSYEDKLKTWQ